MNPTVYNLALVMHIVGITLMAGATAVEYITFRQFWKTIPSDKGKGMVIWRTISDYQKMMGIGMLIIIIGGVVMMYYLHEAWGAQLWFRIKFGLVILVIINGLGIRRILGSRLSKLLAAMRPVYERTPSTLRIRGYIQVVHWIQLVLFLAIYILSIFKFV
ncbi:hypothetical protein [Dyadobacter sp. OTU695]|uniref:hypothetical protein n=1 Tax=Dyadobacter sp. OTU695 TaxID=3043860 RepID=UPI00313B8BAA